jgi:prepilin-type N-terminal cleavage/methylation domain-containing protein
MIKGKRYTAFTLLEMLIVLVLSSLILYLGYRGYESVLSMQKQRDLRFERLFDLRQLDLHLYRLMSESDSVALKEDQLMFFHSGGQQHSLFVGDNHIVNPNPRPEDTLNVALSHVRIFHGEVTELAFETLIDGETLHHRYPLRRIETKALWD